MAQMTARDPHPGLEVRREIARGWKPDQVRQSVQHIGPGSRRSIDPTTSNSHFVHGLDSQSLSDILRSAGNDQEL